MGDILLDTDPEAVEFYAALGRFVHGFSMAEQTLHLYLWEVSGIPLPTLQALVAEQRFAACKDAVRRLFDGRGQALPEIYMRSVDQLARINALRNDIVHLGRTLSDDGLLVSTWERVIPQKSKEYTVTLAMLDDAIADLATARIGLMYLMTPDDDVLQFVRAPWRYKPLAPNQNG